MKSIFKLCFILSFSTIICSGAAFGMLADINEKTQGGRTALHNTALLGNLRAAELFLLAGARIDEKDNYGQTPLHFAVFAGHLDLAHLLLARGALCSEKDSSGATPLLLAAFYGHLEILKLLLKDKASVDEKDKGGLTALHMAAEKGHIEILSFLIESQAAVNERDKGGNTALHWAARQGHPEMAGVLLDNGAEPRITNNRGLNALSFALYNANFAGTVVLTRLMELDDGYTREFLDRRILAHRCGIKGQSKLGQEKFSLEGSHADGEGIAHQQIGMTHYYAKLYFDEPWERILTSLPSESRMRVESVAKNQILKILTSTRHSIAEANSYGDDVDKILEAHSAGKPLSFALYLKKDSHLVAMALVGNKLARCDKAGGFLASSGIWIQTVEPESLKRALAECLNQGTWIYFRHQIYEILGKQDLEHIYQKRQRSGNCGFASIDSLERALLDLQLRPLLGIEAAKDLSRVITKERKKDTIMEALEEYLERHNSILKYPPDLALLGKIHQRYKHDFGRHLRIMIQAWAENKNIDPEDILPGALWHR